MGDIPTVTTTRAPAMLKIVVILAEVVSSISIRFSISINKADWDNPHHEARVVALGEISSA